MGLLIQTYNKLGVLLDMKTGRPKMEPPFDKPGVLYTHAPNEDLNERLQDAPEHVLTNLRKARLDKPFPKRASMQAWEETLYAPLADGTAITGASIEAIMLPIFTLPANYFYAGRSMKWTICARWSTVITTPGTTILKLCHSATGLGATTLATSSTFTADTTAAGVNLTSIVEYWFVNRGQGTASPSMTVGRWEIRDFNNATVDTLIADLEMRMIPASAPAAVNIDTTVAKALSPTYTPSVTTANWQTHIGILEALT